LLNSTARKGGLTRSPELVGRLAGNVLWRLMKFALQQASVCLGSHCARLLRQRKHSVDVDGPSWVATPPGPEGRACGGVSIATGAVRIQRTKMMASKQINKHAKNAAKTNKPARKPERQTRRCISEGRSRSAAAPGARSGAGQAAVASEGAPRGSTCRKTPRRRRSIRLLHNPSGYPRMPI